MAHTRLAPNAPCPCGSGKKYKDCCFNKGFEWLVDEDGNVFKSLPLSGEMKEMLEQQTQRFVAEHGREPGPDDKLFFDAPPLEHLEHEIVQAMQKAGLDPALVYAFEKTGLIVTEDNQNLISDADLAEWEAAVMEYRARQG
jgi:hypothetical protein